MNGFALTDESTVSRIADICPRAMSTYFICLANADSEGNCHFTRDDILNTKIRSWTKFKNDIRSLSQLFLLNFHDQGHEIGVNMIDMETPF